MINSNNKNSLSRRGCFYFGEGKIDFSILENLVK
jgi:hypothetical protein